MDIEGVLQVGWCMDFDGVVATGEVNEHLRSGRSGVGHDYFLSVHRGGGA